MNIRELIRVLLLQFFICYTCTMAATFFFCRLNTPPIDRLEVDYLWQAGIFSALAVLPGAVYFDRNGLTKHQMWVRTAIHTVLLEAVLLTAGWVIGMYRGIGGFFAFAAAILIVNALVRLFSYLGDRSVASAINLQLAEKRKGTEEQKYE